MPSPCDRFRPALGAIALGVLLCLPAALPAVASADTGDPLAYYGGPVAHSMTGVLVDWGHHVNPIYTDPTNGDPGLLKYLASQSGTPNGIGGVLAQYLDATGANSANQVTYAGQFAITPSTTATTLQDAQVAAELVSQIASGALPAPTGDGLSTDYLMLFPAGTTVCDNDGCSGQAFCSYHGSTQLSDGTAVLYEVLPDNTTGPMTQGCGQQSPIRNQTMYLSHEWEESINDPLVDDASSLAPPLAWYDADCPAASSMCGEVADKCNQEPALEGGWTVQLLWSNLDDACVATEKRYATPSASFSVQGPTAPQTPATFVATANDPAGNTASASWQGQQYTIAPGIASLAWNWGDGTPPSSGPQAIHTFAAAGHLQRDTDGDRRPRIHRAGDRSDRGLGAAGRTGRADRGGDGRQAAVGDPDRHDQPSRRDRRLPLRVRD